MSAVNLTENGSGTQDFTFKGFCGTVGRRERKKVRWDEHTKQMLPAEPQKWAVFIAGHNRAWREVLLPIARGMTAAKAVQQACSLFSSPEEIQPTNGWFGKFIDLTKGESK